MAVQGDGAYRGNKYNVLLVGSGGNKTLHVLSTGAFEDVTREK